MGRSKRSKRAHAAATPGSTTPGSTGELAGDAFRAEETEHVASIWGPPSGVFARFRGVFQWNLPLSDTTVRGGNK
jgi:hypothetical protein